MAEFLSPGVRVRELRAGVPQIRGTTTSVAAFIGRCLRGPVNKIPAARVTSFAQFTRIFGSFDPNSFMPDSVKAFFDNGGSEAYIVRVLGSSGGGPNTKALKTLQTLGAVNAAVFTAKGEGDDSNNFNVRTANTNNQIASTIPNIIIAGATTQFNLGPAIAAKLNVGDVVLLFDSAGPTTCRIVVAGIANGIVNAQTSVVVPVGGLLQATTAVTIETFGVTYLYNGAIVYGPVSGLSMSSLSRKNYFITRLMPDDDELPINVVDSSAPFGIAIDNRIVNTDTVNGDALATGSVFTTFADADYIGAASAASTGFYVLDNIRRVRLVACPGVTGVAAGNVSKNLVAYCEARKDCYAVICPPQNTAVAACVTYKGTNIGSSSFGGIYYPWLKVVSPTTNQLAYLPTEGFAMGIMSRTDRVNGISQAPAGDVKGKLVGTYGVERVLSDGDKDLLYPANINPIENIDDVGQCIMGSRTMETSEFNQVHVRRTFIYMEQSLQIGTRFVIFEPNTPATRSKLKRTADAFCEAEWNKGTLQGATVDDAFTNVCNDSNNPDVVVKAQQMFMDTAINVPQTTENLIINIQQDQRGVARATS